MLYAASALALLVGSANGLVVGGIPALRPAGPVVHMNAAEAAAKAEWLAKQDNVPTWAGQAPYRGSVVPTSAPGTYQASIYDDHAGPASRLSASGRWSDVPMATANFQAKRSTYNANAYPMYDDHKFPAARLEASGRWSDVPMSAPNSEGRINDDHKFPAARLDQSGRWSDVPMATPNSEAIRSPANAMPGAVPQYDDHKFPAARLDASGRWSDVPMSAPNAAPCDGSFNDDHKFPVARLEGSGRWSDVPMSQP